MNLTSRKAIGWAALTLMALLALPISQPGAETTGRDFSRCVQTCNAARQSCSVQCLDDCRSLFPGSPQQQSSCISTCKSGCATAEQECKAICRAIKEGTSPNSPS